MNNPKEIFYKIFEDDFESEAIDILKQDLKRELKNHTMK